ncbi:lipoprotein heptaprenylglyceryl N-acetyltransferase LhaT [Bacillus massilinigeriensis]|uniref:DUF1405 domain-containing protein n=1 Tax=Bacillus mediterraneensis TaxID=1805474 RepID=UPI0008F7F80A|nr:DUF1405 domain-containing protein [Bacillus mediterraneensis]
MFKLLYPQLATRSMLWFLLLANIAGTAYGYYWYQWQLADTPAIFLLFVPDSPTASLFFVFVLIGFLLRRNWPYFEALAFVTLFKYGIWAVVMNLLVFTTTGHMDAVGWMLVASHFAMAMEGLLFAPFYRFRLKHLAVAAIFVLHNEIIDYVFMMMPRYHMLDTYIKEISYFTFWLSVISIWVAYHFTIRKKRIVLTIE